MEEANSLAFASPLLNSVCPTRFALSNHISTTIDRRISLDRFRTHVRHLLQEYRCLVVSPVGFRCPRRRSWLVSSCSSKRSSCRSLVSFLSSDGAYANIFFVVSLHILFLRPFLPQPFGPSRPTQRTVTLRPAARYGPHPHESGLSTHCLGS